MFNTNNGKKPSLAKTVYLFSFLPVIGYLIGNAMIGDKMPPPAKTKPTDQIPAETKCKVVAILDGDTFNCLTAENKQIKVRLKEIDAPEKKQDFGQASKQALSSLIYSQQVTVKAKATDKYGRYLGEVFVNDKNVNKLMVYNGFAWAYREYLDDQDYLRLQELAKQQKLGLWQQPNPIYPSDFRHGENK